QFNLVGKLWAEARAESPLTPVPEPETYAMLLAGLGVLGLLQRRRRA
ncbi:MAG: PEP-CTERM sorting domain-containing protein, partial [Paucibacter sp.]|nr:PEP-CTERM sorting domain-containing protein [Roseateles sp.]